MTGADLQRDPVGLGPDRHLLPQVVGIDQDIRVPVRLHVRERSRAWESTHRSSGGSRQREGRSRVPGQRPTRKQCMVHGVTRWRRRYCCLMQTIPTLFIERARALPDVVAAWAPLPIRPTHSSSTLSARTSPTSPMDPSQLRTDPEAGRRIGSPARQHGSEARRTRVHLGANIGPLDAGGHGGSVPRRHHSRHHSTLLDEAVQYQLAHGESALFIVDDDERARGDWRSPNAHPPWSMCSASAIPGGTSSPQTHPTSPGSRKATAVRVDDISTYIYTSGTTGHPKAVVLNHHNFTAVIDAARARLPLEPGERSVVFLPLAHVLQRFTQYLGLVDQTEGWFAPSIDALPDTIAVARPHVLAAVPRMLEKIRAQVEQQAAAKSPRARRIVDWAVSVGQTANDMRWRGHPVGWRLKAQHAIAEQLVFSKIRAGLRGHLRLLISRSSPRSSPRTLV